MMAAKKSVKAPKKTPKKNTGGRSASLQNLRPPWRKGDPSPNPTGRPRSRQFAEGARRWLESPSKYDPDKSNADALVEQWGAAAFKNLPALRELLDRAEGPPLKAQAVDPEAFEQKRKMVESALDALMLETGVERDTAVKHLLDIVPEVSKWIS